MLGGLWTGLSDPLQPPWGVWNPWRLLAYENYLVSGSRGPLNSNCMVQTTKTAFFEFPENLKNTPNSHKFLKKSENSEQWAWIWV